MNSADPGYADVEAGRWDWNQAPVNKPQFA